MLAFAPTQKAIMDRLRGDINVTSLLNKAPNYLGVYDYVTEDTTYPYIVVGEPTSDQFDVKNNDVVDMSITLHVWSSYKGNSEAYKILSAVHEAFKYKLDIKGYKTIKTSYRDAKVFTDIDGVHRHGVFTLLLTLEKESV
ncbi:DUF3168 domain-containing protein [Rummeliibacillus stabekisii]|uniref:DUF3168 domain-containing protein n=1 Tax=Rummeliibacillus stabekisii TaxID=241244 RepID=UPI00203C0D0F|nr:DUF3168 domain-containing protein [Rummeliibacillus stabekisii]